MPHEKQFTNELIHEHSPYLQQHAHNPVQWFSWSIKALEKAKAEDKLIIVSIGYSTCHWCHVMEHESFEDEETAAIMNKNFICIKVDREERPDIDQVYMDAVQLMTGHGGWPLNCITLPDQQPVYGGTYFPKAQWQQVLLQLSNFYATEKNKCIQYAHELTEGIKQIEKILPKPSADGSTSINLKSIYENWSKQFDTIYGGPNRVPKFPLPDSYQFLLQLLFHSQRENILLPDQNQSLKEHINLTLKQMAYGGIYDQLGGGFARYSTDKEWKVPHFEKMLYDNAQLVSLYSNAYKFFKEDLYKQVAEETLVFVQRELSSPEGGFYSALDADSEGVEGKFYVWTKEEIEKHLGGNAKIFCDYYNINEKGYWEHGNYILLRNDDEDAIAEQHQVTIEELRKTKSDCKQKLMEVRDKRVRPGLDNKQICSWNALMLKGYADAYSAFENPLYLEIAERSANFILKYLTADDGKLLRHAGQFIPAFLDDYAMTIEALISLYQITFNESYLNQAHQFTEFVQQYFYDEVSGLFFYTASNSEKLIARKMELQDNVIPSSNSVMAKNLFLLSRYFASSEYEMIARKMLSHLTKEVETQTPWHSNWAQLTLQFNFPFYEVCICGRNAKQPGKVITTPYLPNIMIAADETKSNLPILENRIDENEFQIFICTNNSCLAPVKTIEEAFNLMDLQK